MYLILSYSMLVMVLFGARFDGIFLGLSSNIVSHLLILQENFKGVIDNELELEDFITYHTKVLECWSFRSLSNVYVHTIYLYQLGLLYGLFCIYSSKISLTLRLKLKLIKYIAQINDVALKVSLILPIIVLMLLSYPRYHMGSLIKIKVRF